MSHDPEKYEPYDFSKMTFKPSRALRKRVIGRKGESFRRCIKFHERIVNGKPRRLYLHVTKGWRSLSA